ncbi:carboxymuconolactone decarboxylase family protein [Paracoccus thiocyanatus]|uniref:4-carboxymuconolactone decarboxylase n=1 Tax=Paracoccus thiocyanatus TaxID=34006 RepID=A0A3D8PFC1_9RHOB|nr:carboxymuconolactone decarboxylase family protein [Paracoccus thiocyanatus]RDW14770.1 4-carboxymuconolactone decarboxylase [Paracoccus thiocyanatus]
MRPPELDESALTPSQREVFARIRSGPRGLVQGPLRVWLHSPELADAAQALGAFCRYGTSLGQDLSELAIITVGAWWRAGFEWHVHAPLAIAAGIPEAAVEAIRVGHSPSLERHHALVHRATQEMMESRDWSDATYAALLAELGLAGTVELTGIIGYYGLICMTINGFRVPVPEGVPEPFPGRTPSQTTAR